MKKTFALAVAVVFLAAMPSVAAEINRSVTVNGVCHKEIVPDRASLNMVSFAKHPTDVKAAVNSAVKAYEAVRAQVLRLKLKDGELTTSEYNIGPVYEWADNRQVLRGYQARIGLEVETSEIERMGEVMAIAADNNIKEIGAWILIVSQKKRQQVLQECLAEAVMDAKFNAEKIAAAAGVKLGHVINMTQDGNYAQPVMMKHSFAREMTADAAAQAPSIEAGKEQITINVRANFGLE